MGKRFCDINTMCPDRNHDEELPTSGCRARDTWKTLLTTLKSSALRSQRKPHRAEALPVANRGTPICGKAEISLHVNLVGRRATNPSTSNLMAAKGILWYLSWSRNEGIILRKPRDLELKAFADASYGGSEARSQSGVLITLGEQPKARCSIAIDNRGRIHSGLRGGERPCVGEAVPEETKYKNQSNTDIGNGQRGGLQFIQDLQIPATISPHRTSLPLPPSTSPRATPTNPHNTGEGQPCRHPNKAYPYESDTNLESELAEFDWEEYFQGAIISAR